MCWHLICVPIKIIKPLLVGIACVMKTTQSPFANASRFVPRTLHKLTKGFRICWNWCLPIGITWTIGPDIGMAWVLPHQQRSTAWRTNCVSTIVICKAHSIASKFIKLRGFNELLPIISYIAIAQIICKDINNIWFLLLCTYH